MELKNRYCIQSYSLLRETLITKMLARPFVDGKEESKFFFEYISEEMCNRGKYF